MPSILELLVVISPPAIIGGVVSIALHEGLHWVIDRLFTREVGISRDGINPNIQINDPYAVPTWAIRVSGAAPFLVGVIMMFVVLYTASPFETPNFWNVFFYSLGLATALPSLGSGGDILAVFAPEKFQEFAASTGSDAPGLHEAIRLLRE